MSSEKEIKKGSTVKYNGGFYRVSACFKNTVNLSYIWNSKHVYYKGVPKSEVVEAYQEHMDAWSKSESYRCM